MLMNHTYNWTDAVVNTYERVFAVVHFLKKMQRLLPFHIITYQISCNSTLETVVKDVTGFGNKINVHKKIIVLDFCSILDVVIHIIIIDICSF